eukprot:scaffold238684_cov14-Tisochrysis_lutea.AAC.1
MQKFLEHSQKCCDPVEWVPVYCECVHPGDRRPSASSSKTHKNWIRHKLTTSSGLRSQTRRIGSKDLPALGRHSCALLPAAGETKLAP